MQKRVAIPIEFPLHSSYPMHFSHAAVVLGSAGLAAAKAMDRGELELHLLRSASGTNRGPTGDLWRLCFLGKSWEK